MATKRLPKYNLYNGFRLTDTFTEENITSAMTYEPQKDDIFVVTYPKCGTTWMCQIVLLLLRKGVPLSEPLSYFTSCPFLEYFGADSVHNMVRPGCIKSHLPFNYMRFSEKAKYFYVARHPADCVVSFYNHTKFFNMYRFSDGKFDDFFDLFVKGETDFNDYFDNLLSWYEQRHRDNIFFTTYEEMVADHPGAISKVAKFLGGEYADALQKDEVFFNNVLRYSSFDYMKETVNNIFEASFVNPSPESGKIYECIKCAEKDGFFTVGSFIRKGMVGEGKAVLSEEQIDRLTERVLEKTKGSDVMSLWK